MAIILILIGAAASAMPIAATILVSMSSRREDRAWSLAGPPRGRAEALARRIVNFHSEGIWPARRCQQTPSVVARSEASRRLKVLEPTAAWISASHSMSEASYRDPQRRGRNGTTTIDMAAQRAGRNGSEHCQAR